MYSRARLFALSSLFAIALLTGCASLRKDPNFDAIAKGMTKAEVVARIGEPERVKGPAAFWRYGIPTDYDFSAVWVIFDVRGIVVSVHHLGRHSGVTSSFDQTERTANSPTD